MAVPTKCITETEARQLQDNWASTRAVAIEREMGSTDTREFVFSVVELEEFLTYVKSESSKQGFSAPGVRIYFAAYDNDSTDKATVFLSPTQTGAATSNNNYNIQPMNVVTGGDPPKTY